MKAKYLWPVVAALLVAAYFQFRPMPQLTMSTDPSGLNLPIDKPITLTFNRPVSDSEAALSVAPSGSVKVGWSANRKQVVLTPLETWEYGREYIVKVGNIQAHFVAEPMPSFSVVAGGDILLDKLPGDNIARLGPTSVFAGVRQLLQDADIAFANLESPASSRGTKISPKNFTFRSTPEALDALVDASIDVVAFANNHSMDFGVEAFLDTMTHLQERGVDYVGAGKDLSEALKPFVNEVNGVKVAFLAFTQKSFLPSWSYDLWAAQESKPGVVFLDGEEGRKVVLAAVAEAKKAADVVLLSLHWGYEGTLAPQNWQRELGKAAIDAGATAIIGHHPHLPFGVEIYAGKPIIYSLGNFLFHPYDPAARESFVARMEITLRGEVELALYPILMNEGAVTLLTGEQADRILGVIADRSKALGTVTIRQGDALIVRTSQD